MSQEKYNSLMQELKDNMNANLYYQLLELIDDVKSNKINETELMQWAENTLTHQQYKLFKQCRITFHKIPCAYFNNIL